MLHFQKIANQFLTLISITEVTKYTSTNKQSYCHDDAVTKRHLLNQQHIAILVQFPIGFIITRNNAKYFEI